MAKKRSNQMDYDLKSVWFSENEKNKFTSWVKESKQTLSEALSTLLDQNCKVSALQDQSNGSYLISVTPKNSKLPVYKHVFMFRHQELEKCYLIASFYYTEVLDNGNQFTGDTDDTNW